MSDSNFFHAHLHTQFSTLDGMVPPKRLIEKAAKEGQPAIAFTDHGSMAATVQGYMEAKKHGIKFFPGVEGYLIDPAIEDWENPPKGTKVGRFHFILLARSEDGYKALVKFVSKTHTRPRFNRFPRATLADLAELGQNHGDDVILLTGCYFGYLQQTLVHEGMDKADKVLKMYSQWFPHTFVELQHHNIDHGSDADVLPEFGDDDDIVSALYTLAKANGLPVIATQDAHYCDQREKKAHALMKRMTYGGSDDEFPGDSFHMASWEWVAEHYSEGVWKSCERGYKTMLDLHDVTIEPLDNFRPDVPKMPGVKNPKTTVRKGCLSALDAYAQKQGLSARKRRTYLDRIDYELNVINHLGMASYFVIWQKFAEWCRDEGIAIEARGSGNGSLVNFLLRITQVDPIIWGVDFERFLTKDRIKSPDIDMDIEDVHRPRAMMYLLSLFEAVQIGTWGKLGSRYDEREDTEKGSVLVTWQSSKRRECDERAAKVIERKGGKKGDITPLSRSMYASKYGHIQDIRQVEEVSPRDYEALVEISQMNSVYRSYGVHAGGVLLGGERVRIDDYIPTMLVASSDTRVSQYDMDDVEQFGLLKMDILGQAVLRTMKTTQELIGKDDVSDFTWIKDNDTEACKILRSGRTETGVFHQEGYTKAKGGRELGVKSTNDAVLMQALYMPGAMDSGQTAHFIRARNNRDFRESIEYVHPIFEEHLKPTHGAYVYQNQVLAILRDMGMSVVDTNLFLKVVKASGAGAKEANEERMEGLYEHFVQLWDKHGIDHDRLDETWDALCGFGAYGFNKAHAAGYGIRMYRCAYLKAHYPLEFMTGTLQTWAGSKKEPTYVNETRRLGIRIMPPDVNVSGASWTMDKKRNAIRKGLVSIPGIGDAAAQAIEQERLENGDYTSLQDMVDRLPARAFSGGAKYMKEGVLSGNIEKFYRAKALRSVIGDEELD